MLKLKIVFLFLFIVFATRFEAQGNLFQELDLNRGIKDTEKWNLAGGGSLKYLYNKDGYRKFGLSFNSTRKLGEWSIIGGLSSSYLSDDDVNVVNSLELKPWMGLNLRTHMTGRLYFSQVVKSEMRAFFYFGETTNKTYVRARYKIGFDYLLKHNKETTASWKVKGTLEWYFIKSPAFGERFPDSKEFTLKLIRDTKKSYSYGFYYQFDRYYRTLTPDGKDGHLMGFEINF